MTVPGNEYALTLFFLTVTVSASYALGRLHQWYRQTTERDDAFRQGYDRASHSLFSLVARPAERRPRPQAPPGEVRTRLMSTGEVPTVVVERSGVERPASPPRGRHARESTGEIRPRVPAS